MLRKYAVISHDEGRRLLQVTLLNIGQRLPGIEAFANEGVEVLLKAQALEMGGEICHSCARGVSSTPSLAQERYSQVVYQPGRYTSQAVR